MDLTRITRKPVFIDLTTVLEGAVPGAITSADVALLPPRTDPDASTVWTSVTYANPTANFVIAGPDAGGSGAIVAAGTSDLWVRATAPTWVDAALVERVNVLDGPALTLPADPSTLTDAYLAGMVAGATATRDALDARYVNEGQTTFASRYTTAATAAATARLLGRLDRGVEGATVLVVGDSTGNETTEWVYLSMQALAARYPAYTLTYRLWNDTNGTYDAPTTVQTGTGAQTLAVYNCSVAGKSTSYVLGSRWANAIEAVPEPDLIMVNHGHNMGDPTTTNARMTIRAGYLALTEEMTLAFPSAGVVLIAQNPTFLTGRETWQAIKAQVLQRIAAQRGYGYVDVHQAFTDTGNAAALLSDQIHPTAAGSTLWATVVGNALTGRAEASQPTQPPSALTQAATGLLPNPQFADWTGALPDGGWALTNATVAKDTTNFETGSWGMQITAGGSAGTAHAEISGSPASFGILGRVIGRYITVAARVYVPSGYTGVPSMIIVDQAGSAQQARVDLGSDQFGRFFWLIASKRILSPATSLAVRFAVRLTGSAAGSITVDRFNVVEGDLPRDSVTGLKGATGATGSAGAGAAGVLDHLSTFGNLPLVTAMGMGGGVGVQAANKANLYRIKAPRALTIASLMWQVHTTATANYDIGIYDTSGNRLWSKGSTAVPGTGTVVTETVSPTVSLASGTEYFVAIGFDSTTPLARGTLVSTGELTRGLTGTLHALEVSSVFPLPATLTPGATPTARLAAITLRES